MKSFRTKGINGSARKFNDLRENLSKGFQDPSDKLGDLKRKTWKKKMRGRFAIFEENNKNTEKVLKWEFVHRACHYPGAQKLDFSRHPHEDRLTMRLVLRSWPTITAYVTPVDGSAHFLLIRSLLYESYYPFLCYYSLENCETYRRTWMKVYPEQRVNESLVAHCTKDRFNITLICRG